LEDSIFIRLRWIRFFNISSPIGPVVLLPEAALINAAKIASFQNPETKTLWQGSGAASTGAMMLWDA